MATLACTSKREPLRNISRKRLHRGLRGTQLTTQEACRDPQPAAILPPPPCSTETTPPEGWQRLFPPWAALTCVLVPPHHHYVILLSSSLLPYDHGLPPPHLDTPDKPGRQVTLLPLSCDTHPKPPESRFCHQKQTKLGVHFPQPQETPQHSPTLRLRSHLQVEALSVGVRCLQEDTSRLLEVPAPHPVLLPGTLLASHTLLRVEGGLQGSWEFKPPPLEELYQILP